jgi:hypothetical protein
MVPSLTLAVTVDRGFSLGKTIHIRSLEFIIDCFSDLSLSPRRDGSDVWAMIADATEEFHTASNGEGGIDLPSPRRHDAKA